MQQYFPDRILYGGDYNPEQWSEETWREDMRLMKLAHVNMVSINIFSWTLLEPEPHKYHFEQLDRIMDMLAEHGIYADLATATASPPTWMSRLYPSILPVTQQGVRMSHGSRQHYCPNSPDYRRKAGALVEQIATRYAKHPALKMWHLNNEYGCHTGACYCENCAAAFRKWLQERYQTLDKVNQAWGTTFWSQRYYEWEDVLPPRATPAQTNPTQTLDYWRFMNDSLRGCYELEEEILRRATPSIPLTTNLMVAFKPVDVFDWAKHMDIISFDMYPAPHDGAAQVAMPHDIMRGAKGGQPHIVMEMSPSQVNWQPQNPHKRPGQLRMHIMQSIAHGANGALFFQWRQSMAGAEKYHSAVVSHEGSEQNRIFKQVAQAGAELAKLAPQVANTRIHAKVALLMDWQSWWSSEYQPGPSNQLRYYEQILTYYKALYARNIAVDIVSPEAELGEYKLVIAPLLHMIMPGVEQKLKGFVEQGGTFLTTFFSGIVDQNEHVIPGGYPGALRELLGIYVEEFDPLTPQMSNEVVIEEGELRGRYAATKWGELVHLKGAQALARFGQDYYAQHPAITEHSYGQGKAYYVATHPEQRLVDTLIKQICAQAGVEPVLDTPEGVEVTLREGKHGEKVYFVLNQSKERQQITLPEGSYTSLLDERKVQGTVEMGPLDVLVLKK
ncbi:beta-galactosidase [Ktedonobacter sp. SOSP1-85]|uniref:beta-galactosidase n=1 Tax=Ktedonobacter sp. SOSP1-85 TaxID=2778367 RepID=UPI001916A236|nr:beta-galactosidase [Ktedonobacter sp. SOSP1-85]GHO73235.1 beta-galactosidase [Ktedonobacter sp. SOSP1-85]